MSKEGPRLSYSGGAGPRRRRPGLLPTMHSQPTPSPTALTGEVQNLQLGHLQQEGRHPHQVVVAEVESGEGGQALREVSRELLGSGRQPVLRRLRQQARGDVFTPHKIHGLRGTVR